MDYNFLIEDFDRESLNLPESAKINHHLLQNDQSEIYQVADKSDIDNLDKLIQEKNRAMFTYWWNHYDLKILRCYKTEKKLFEQKLSSKRKDGTVSAAKCCCKSVVLI